MEHIVQFAIGIDDDKIRETLERAAVNDIEQSIKKDVLNKILYTYLHRDANFQEDPLSSFTEKILRDLFEGWKDQIIQKAGELLCDYLKRTKAVKDLVEEVKKC